MLVVSFATSLGVPFIKLLSKYNPSGNVPLIIVTVAFDSDKGKAYGAIVTCSSNVKSVPLVASKFPN